MATHYEKTVSSEGGLSILLLATIFLVPLIMVAMFYLPWYVATGVSLIVAAGLYAVVALVV